MPFTDEQDKFLNLINELRKKAGRDDAELRRINEGLKLIDQGKFPVPSGRSAEVDVLREELAPPMFVSGEQQLMHVAYRFGDFYGGEQIETARVTMPDFQSHGLVALVLVPHFYSVEQTFDQLWRAVADTYGPHMRWDGLKSDPAHLRLLEGIEFAPNTLTWQIIDFGANRNRKPFDARGPDSPSAGCLAAAWHHAKWIHSINGDDVPYIWLPGYEVTVPYGEPWRYTPRLFREKREDWLVANRYRGTDSSLAVPVLRKS